MVFDDRPVYQERHAAQLIVARRICSPQKGRSHLRRPVDRLFAFSLQSHGGPYIFGNFAFIVHAKACRRKLRLLPREISKPLPTHLSFDELTSYLQHGAEFPGAVILFVIYIIATRSFYSIFTSSAYRNRDAKWRFPQEIATLAEAKTQAREVKML
jgi:hypothetical protein